VRRGLHRSSHGDHGAAAIPGPARHSGRDLARQGPGVDEAFGVQDQRRPSRRRSAASVVEGQLHLGLQLGAAERIIPKPRPPPPPLRLVPESPAEGLLDHVGEGARSEEDAHRQEG